MANIFDEIGPSLATSLIGSFDRPATIQEPSEAYDPNTGKTAAVVTPRAVSISAPITMGIRAKDDATLQRSDLSTYLSAEGLGFEPKVGFYVDVEGIRYQTVQVNPLPAGGGLKYAYGLILRR